ncbi:hypothetical protein [Clostridium aminobutyricum]|nr:hypothetical protein [Clostridium aminobutyricum]
MKSIARANLILSIINVCLGTAMIVLSAITTIKFSKKKADRITM